MPGRVFIKSSELRWVRYDPTYQTLTVEFISGGTYCYHGVPAAKYKSLLAAESRGRYFNSQIREIYPFDHLT